VGLGLIIIIIIIIIVVISVVVVVVVAAAAAVAAVVVCIWCRRTSNLIICLSLCHVPVLWKRLNILSQCQHHTAGSSIYGVDAPATR